MKTIYKNRFVALFLLGIFVAPGCKKQLDINVSPNSVTPDLATPALVLPGAMLGTAASVGGDYAILGSIWAEYAAQNISSNQYRTVDAYQVSTTSFNRAYNNLYVSI